MPTDAAKLARLEANHESLKDDFRDLKDEFRAYRDASGKKIASLETMVTWVTGAVSAVSLIAGMFLDQIKERFGVV